MANMEDQIRDLRELNNELVQQVRHWRLTAAQHEKEKLDLMKEINELRLKISRLRSGGAAEARKLDTALQSASEEVLNHLVQASGAVTRSMEYVKQYIIDRQQLDTQSPRWSSLYNTPNTEKVHRVPPTLMGGQSIQPVVALSRTMLNSDARSVRSPNNVTQRAVPMRMLQDVYIPLTRIDMSEIQASLETEGSLDNSADDQPYGADDQPLDDSAEQPMDESQNASNADEFDSPRLDDIMEDLEPEDVETADVVPDDQVDTPPRSRETIVVDNPLEGPSWLLDTNRRQIRPKTKEFLEADSTTPTADAIKTETERDIDVSTPRAFTPTVRRRKRAATPSPEEDSTLATPADAATPPSVPPPVTSAPSGRPSKSSRGDCKTGRILKVVVAKMRLSDDPGGAGDSPAAPPPPVQAPPLGDASPPKRSRDTMMTFDAPSPNGTTDTGVIVSETHNNRSIPDEPRAISRASRTSADSWHDSRTDSIHSDSEGSQRATRTRRPRKNVTYKEKPLNSKLRR